MKLIAWFRSVALVVSLPLAMSCSDDPDLCPSEPLPPRMDLHAFTSDSIVGSVSSGIECASEAFDTGSLHAAISGEIELLDGSIDIVEGKELTVQWTWVNGFPSSMLWGAPRDGVRRLIGVDLVIHAEGVQGTPFRLSARQPETDEASKRPGSSTVP